MAAGKLSEKIVGAPLVVLFGAGASMHLDFPLMRELYRDVREHVFGRQGPGSGGWCRIWRQAGGRQREGNLEEVIERLEHGATALIDKGNPEGCGYQKRAGALARFVKQEIARRFVATHGPSPARDAYAPFLDECLVVLGNSSGGPYALPVFTTNYDLALDFRTQPAPVVNGIGSNHEWSRANFDTVGEADMRHPLITLFKLHGSANWQQRQSGAKTTIYSFHPDDPPSRWWQKSAMIWPQPTKIVDEDPFLTAYEYLQRCLDRAQLCVVVGYSFNDRSAQVVFGRAARANGTLRILVVDPEPRAIRDRLVDACGLTKPRIDTCTRRFTARGVGTIADRISESLNPSRKRPDRRTPPSCAQAERRSWEVIRDAGVPAEAGWAQPPVAVYPKEGGGPGGLDAWCTQWLLSALGDKATKLQCDEGLVAWLRRRLRGVCVLPFAALAEDQDLGREAQDMMAQFVQRGGGVVATHDAIAMSAEHDALRQILGASHGHESVRHVDRLVRYEHAIAKWPEAAPLLDGIPDVFRIHDELLAVPPGKFTGVRLLSLEEGDPPGYAAAWARCDQEIGKGRTVYLAVGHLAPTYEVPEIRTFLANAIRWAGRFDEKD